MAHYTIVKDESAQGYDDHESTISNEDLLLEKSIKSQIQKSFYRRHSRPILLHSLCFSLNLLFLISILRWATRDCPYGIYGPDLVYSEHDNQLSNTLELTPSPIAPAREAIAYQRQQWDSENIFYNNGSVDPGRLHKGFGPPSLESDNAWTELVQCNYLSPCGVDD